MAEQWWLSIHVSEDEQPPRDQDELEPATARSDEPERGEQQHDRRQISPHHDPDRSAGRAVERAEDVWHQELWELGQGEVPGAELRTDVAGQIRMAQVVDHRQQHRGREQCPGNAPQADLGQEPAEFRALEAATAPAEPRHGHQPVDVGDLGKARVGRQGAGKRDQAPTRPPMCSGRVKRPLDPQQQHGEKRQRIHSGIGEPGELAVQRKRDRPGDARRAGDADPPQQAVRADSGDQLEQHVLVELTVGERRQQRRRKQGGGLRLTKQRHPRGLVRVPPREVEVQNVERGKVPDRLRGESVTRVDRRPAAEHAVRDRLRQPAAGVKRVRVKEPEQGGQIGDENGDGDRQQRHGVRREADTTGCHPSRPPLATRWRIAPGRRLGRETSDVSPGTRGAHSLVVAPARRVAHELSVNGRAPGSVAARPSVHRLCLAHRRSAL